MIEFYFFVLMFNGNVGIFLFIFRELIRICKLFFYVIKKLDFNFFIGKFKKKYSNVLLDYISLEKGRVFLKLVLNDRDYYSGMNVK